MKKYPEVFVSKYDEKIKITNASIVSAALNNRIIELIKYYRLFTNAGLKDSKDVIDSCKFPCSLYTDADGINRDHKINPNLVLSKFFEHHLEIDLSKDEFLDIIKDALNNMEQFRCDDMIKAVEFLLANIKENGGLRAIAEQRHKFIESL